MVHTVQAPWRTTLRCSAVVIALALGVAPAAAPLAGNAAPPDAAALQPGPAKDLTLIPSDAAAFCRLRVGDFWKSDLYKKLQADKTFSGQFATDFRNKVGLEPTAIETVTCVALRSPGQAAQKEDRPVLVIVTTNQPLDSKTIIKKAMPDAEQRQHGSKTYYLAKKDHGPAVYFMDDHLVVLGNEKAMQQLIDGWKGMRTDGPLAPMIKTAADHHIAAAFQTVPGQGLKLKDGKPLDDEALRALRELKLGTFTADFASNKCTARVHLTFPNDAKAKEALPAVKKGLEHVETMVLYMANAAIEGQKDPDVTGLTKPLGLIREAIVAGKVEQQGADIRVQFDFMLDANDRAALLRGMARTMFADRHTDQK